MPLDERTRRKLAAILSADVVGYSRLMAEDERATLATLTAYRQVLAQHIAVHDGRVVDSPGDALLAEFPSAVEAVQCAVEIQRELAGRNASLPDHRRMHFRIGVNLGDVMEQEGALYGDGVNIAARLESLAESGGICVSGTVYDHVEGKLSATFKFAGEQTVKNIAKPVRVYHVALGPQDPRPSVAKPRGARRRAVLVAATAILIVVTALTAWTVGRQRQGTHGKEDAVLAMPTGPVIAVLPFTNMSGDPKQDYFSDGLTEDIITELARFKDLNILARNTTAQYKGQAVDIPAIGRKLGARYVVGGGVRKSGDHVRITAQLIDAGSGAHIWGEKYDRNLSDIFVVQDEIANRVVATITGGDSSVLKRAAREVVGKKSPSELKAYEHVLQAGRFVNWSEENYRAAKAHLEKAIELAPDYARARQVYAYTILYGWIGHFEEAPAPPAEIIRNAIKSVELDPNDHRAHRTAAAGYFFAKQLDPFERHATIAIELAPNDVEVLSELGALFTFSGHWDRGIKLVTKAYTLNPDLTAGWYHAAKHYDHFRKGEYRQALDIVRGHPDQNILHQQWKYVAAYAELGNMEKAREHWKKCVEIDPTWSAARMREELRLWNVPEPFIQRYLQSFAKAGYTLQQ